MSAREAFQAADDVIQRVHDRAVAERRLTAAQLARRPSDLEIEAVWAGSRAAGEITPELEREHTELVALRRYARTLELRWDAALESSLARSRLKEAHRAATRARREAGLPRNPPSSPREPTWRYDLARGGRP